MFFNFSDVGICKFRELSQRIFSINISLEIIKDVNYHTFPSDIKHTTSQNQPKPAKTSQNLLPKTTHNQPKPPKTTHNLLTKTTHNQPKPPKTTQNQPDLVKTTQKSDGFVQLFIYSKILENICD